MAEQVRRPSGLPRYLGVALVLLLLLLWVAWWQWDRVGSWLGGGPASGAVESTPAQPVAEATPPVADPATGGKTLRGVAEERWRTLMQAAPEWPADLEQPLDCDAVELALARVCAAIDAREDFGEQRVAGGSCGMLRQVVERLVARPPELSSELKSYEAILGNVFRLFRALGRDRIDLMRRTLAEEQAIVEPAAMALYRWLISRERCARTGTTGVTIEPLYAYAGFLFHTLGGQAYLRRRSPRVEAMAGFYALLILDRAERGGHNPAGVDPRREIRRTRELIAAEEWVFGERYLEVLDRLAREWEARAGG